jgi:tetratricopeptide (TPR) repeat protein
LLVGLLLGVGGCSILPGLRSKDAAEEPKDKEAIVHKASTYVVFGEFREKAALAKECNDAQRQQLREEARLSYLEALKVDPKYLPAYTALARIQQAAGDHAGAVTIYQKALDLAPGDAGLWFDLGMCQCRLRDWPRALGSLRKAMEINPGNRQYASVTGLTLARAGRWDEAYEVLRKVNGEARAHYDLARMLCHTEQLALARKHAEAAVAADPKFKEARTLLDEMDGKTPAPLVQTAGLTEKVDCHVKTAAATVPAGPATAPLPKIITPGAGARSAARPILLPPLPVVDMNSPGQ